MGLDQDPTRTSKSRSVPERRADLLDFNVLPRRLRRPRVTWRAVAPWLSLLVLVGVVYPLFTWFAAANAEFDRTSNQLFHLQSTLTAGQAPSGTEAALETMIADVEEQTSQLNLAAQGVDIQQIAWGETIRFALGQAPAGANITHVDQATDTLTLSGTAQSYRIPLEYGRMLEATGRFLSVRVDIISLVPKTSPTAAATATPARTSGSSTPTPALEAPGEPLYLFQLTIVVRASNVITPIPEATDAP